ncbi:unnamed protein product [Adineta steineri]|uniref:Carrier domain-containing protein n=1 Tax=Adineta steineri TaxID=433720 RepID=A0A815Q9V2_9BILA|nr:unnamed protein product [Adineta steineri]CAF3960527.1 unnamed protein product [Adineta steineri]
MQLYHQYKTTFHLETKSLSISNLFQFTTIIDHAKFIQQAINTEQHFEDCWSSLHLTQARASFAQERIFLDEQVRFSFKESNTTYLVPIIYRLSSISKTVSIVRLHRALQEVVKKHSILRTALYLDTNGALVQHCLDINDTHEYLGFTVINHYGNDEFQKQIPIIMNEPKLIDLAKGRVIHCHILRYDRNAQLSSQNDDLLCVGDLILLNLHHASFDAWSVSIFFHDLTLAYESDSSLSTDDNVLRYIDYSVHERQMDMTQSREFWHSQLKEYDIKHLLSLPVDRYRLHTERRSAAPFIDELNFNNDTSTSFLNYASSHSITPYQLALTTFYVFLFKLTNCQSDLCISSFYANRHRTELQNMIGMFVATLPYRIQLDPRWSFDELAEHVREKCSSIFEHSHYPLQQILADSNLNHSNAPFLKTLFHLHTVVSEEVLWTVDGASLEPVSSSVFLDAQFDLELVFGYNPTPDENRLSCGFLCLPDAFDETTFNAITRRFRLFYSQLFTTNLSKDLTDKFHISIKNLSVLLPEEADEIQGIVFCRLLNIGSEAQAFHAQTSIALGLLPLTPLEEHLRCIFGEAFGNESPNINMSFEQMGGTSINVLWACSLIRRQIEIKIEPTLLFANPSVRQLACAIKPWLNIRNELSITSKTLD